LEQKMTHDHKTRTRRDFLRDIGRGAAGLGLGGVAGLSLLAGHGGATAHPLTGSASHAASSGGPLGYPYDPYLDPDGWYDPRAGVPDPSRSRIARPDGLAVDERGELYRRTAPPARVSLVKGTNRRDMVFDALKLIENDILGAIRGREVWIKPNVVTPINPLGSLHVDAVRGILDFLAPHYKKKITIGEAATLDTWKGFETYGYFALEKEYNVKLVDLNRVGEFEYRYVIDKNNRPIPIRIVKAFLRPNRFMISAAPMKTHNIVLVTLSLKNVILGAPLNDYKKNDKGLMHTSTNSTANDICHYNMFHIAQEVFPDLAVIDGFQAMEGKGPAWGTPVDARVVLAGLDALATDTVGATVMGFDPRKAGYLAAMADAGMGQGDLAKITVVGSPLDECRCHFKLDDRTAEMYGIEQ
jgi:uncharacterized protein (DUF362 family)